MGAAAAAAVKALIREDLDTGRRFPGLAQLIIIWSSLLMLQ